MLERAPGGVIVFCCDLCSEELDTDEGNFHAAKEILDEAGWLTRKAKGEWIHVCPTHSPEEVVSASD